MSELNVRQAARLLNVHENTVRNWADRGVLPVSRVLPSGYRRFDAAVVSRLAATLRETTREVER